MHSPYSVSTVFMLAIDPHLTVNTETMGRTARKKARPMNTSHTVSRTLSVIALAAITATFFIMAFAPNGSLYAG